MSTNDTLFQYATRNALRFQSPRGELDVERLWQVPLRGNNGFNLDVIAQTANKAAEAAGTASFVDADKTTVVQERAKIIFEVVKAVITVKVTEEKAAQKAAADRAELNELLEVLASKQKGDLANLSAEDLRARIAKLRGE